MKIYIANILILILTITTGCKDEEKFPEVKDISEFKKTQFIPTLEYKISTDKNSVYCATLLFAWDEIRKEINSPLTISEDYFELNQLNQSTSFVDVLKSGEYSVSSQIDGELINARAEFNNSLPFEFKLQSFNNQLIFEREKVSSFGITGFDSYEQRNIVIITYYKNKDNFIVKLLPKNKEHEIILFKSELKFNSIAEMSSEINRLSKIGMKEMNNEKINWKYNFMEEDIIIIPKFNFNIKANFKSIEGNQVSSNKQNYRIESAWQRTAFSLDESGAEIESEAETEVAVDADEENEKPKPKEMIFNKPFLILLQRTDANNPYFGLFATNTELMLKE